MLIPAMAPQGLPWGSLPCLEVVPSCPGAAWDAALENIILTLHLPSFPPFSMYDTLVVAPVSLWSSYHSSNPPFLPFSTELQKCFSNVGAALLA